MQNPKLITVQKSQSKSTFNNKFSILQLQFTQSEGKKSCVHTWHPVHVYNSLQPVHCTSPVDEGRELPGNPLNGTKTDLSGRTNLEQYFSTQSFEALVFCMKNITHTVGSKTPNALILTSL